MKQQSLASRMTYGRAIPIERIVKTIGERAQGNTQHYGKRPYGVGLLIAGIDDSGPHLFEFMPSGLTQEMLACAIGGRSQMARTYLERNLQHFADASEAQLIQHGLSALKESLSQDKELTVENTSVGVIGLRPGSTTGNRVQPFKLYDGHDMAALLASANEAEAGGAEGETMDLDS